MKTLRTIGTYENLCLEVWLYLSDSVAEVNVVDVDVRDHLSDVGLTEVVDVLLSNQELRLSGGHGDHSSNSLKYKFLRL